MAQNDFEIDQYIGPASPIPARRTRRQWLKDMALYTLVSLLLVSLPFAAVILDWHVHAVFLYLGCAFLFVGAMAFALLNRWWLLRRKKIWVYLGMLFLAHIPAYASIHAYGGNRFLYGMLCVLELGIAMDLFARVDAARA